MGRDEMVNYLGVVTCLEINISNLNEEIKKVDHEMKDVFVSRKFDFPPDILKILLKSLLLSALAGFFVFYGLCELASSMRPPHNNDDAIDIILFIIICIISAALVILLMYHSKGLRLMRKFIEFKKIEKIRLQKTPNIMDELNYSMNYLLNLLERTQYILDEAYDFNIIYTKYRNLPAVYTMYEYFLAGSVDTLKEAINKYDNESRLDNIITGISEINNTVDSIYDEILFQSRILEENTRLLKQQVEYSQQQIEYLDQISNNTRLTALNTNALLLIEEARELRRMYS